MPPKKATNGIIKKLKNLLKGKKKDNNDENIDASSINSEIYNSTETKLVTNTNKCDQTNNIITSNSEDREKTQSTNDMNFMRSPSVKRSKYQFLYDDKPTN